MAGRLIDLAVECQSAPRSERPKPHPCRRTPQGTRAMDKQRVYSVSHYGE
jgi:hypothetical protein